MRIWCVSYIKSRNFRRQKYPKENFWRLAGPRTLNFVEFTFAIWSFFKNFPEFIFTMKIWKITGWDSFEINYLNSISLFIKLRYSTYEPSYCPVHIKACVSLFFVCRKLGTSKTDCLNKNLKDHVCLHFQARNNVWKHIQFSYLLSLVNIHTFQANNEMVLLFYFIL